MDRRHGPVDGPVVDGGVDRRLRQFDHKAGGPVFPIRDTLPDQHIDDHPVVPLGDPSGEKPRLLEQPGVDVGVGEQEILDRKAPLQIEGRHLDGLRRVSPAQPGCRGSS